jgi:hypothetical protein
MTAMMTMMAVKRTVSRAKITRNLCSLTCCSAAWAERSAGELPPGSGAARERPACSGAVALTFAVCRDFGHYVSRPRCATANKNRPYAIHHLRIRAPVDVCRPG